MAVAGRIRSQGAVATTRFLAGGLRGWIARPHDDQALADPGVTAAGAFTLTNRNRRKHMNNDIAELTRLNHDYVASVQNSDVKRFDEILAQDFYCSNPDKSLVDRAAFLQQTAKPIAIKNLKAED